MTATESLFDLPSGPIPDRVAAILDLLALDPAAEADRRRIVEAIVSVALSNKGRRVDPNRVRALLQDANGDLVVRPRHVGSVYFSLRKRGVLVELAPKHWVVSDDHRGGNAGKPARTYRLTEVKP